MEFPESFLTDNNISVETETEAKAEANDENDRIAYKDSTYEIVSKIAYLIGVPKHIFENRYEPPKTEIYEQLDKDKPARIIRHLCILRTWIERNFKRINEQMRTGYLSIYSIPEDILQNSLIQLSEDGIYCIKSAEKPSRHIIEINKLISDRINNCKALFPLWLDWQYVKGLFIMPDGLKELGTKIAADIYYSSLNCYPYKMYINWAPKEVGNILYNDKKFVTLLYEMNGDSFNDYSMVSDAGSHVKGNIYEFIENSEKIFFVVDCENSDPYKLYATLKNLDSQYLQKISSILLFDDEHSASAWRILNSFTDIPIEHMMIDRVKQDKSLVDVKLITRTCKEHYQNSVDSFVLVSSDSDFWGLISALPDARFLVMIEHEKCGPDLINALSNANIFFCYIDDFYSANAEEIKHYTLFKEISDYLHGAVRLNVYEMLKQALAKARTDMSAAEQYQFIEKHLKTMQVVIDDNGEVTLELKRK